MRAEPYTAVANKEKAATFSFGLEQLIELRTPVQRPKDDVRQ